jgi:hypothetical protein
MLSGAEECRARRTHGYDEALLAGWVLCLVERSGVAVLQMIISVGPQGVWWWDVSNQLQGSIRVQTLRIFRSIVAEGWHVLDWLTMAYL